ncbi:hypothetical protein pah_c050o124 [Parachlamydia acanthamoebae str. Hall's coccus]|jgi:hypothetical protein|nr:hypothetical protein pah_c050o124 [Parachlamydia acanthamoebae str. Hall's coccus]
MEFPDMRRSICYCDPHHAFAGEVNTWKFIYTTSVALPKKTRLKFDLMSEGRDIDWEVPSANLKKGKNVIYAELENGKLLTATEIETPERFTPQFEFTLPDKVEAGSNITIIVGSPKLDDDSRYKKGTRTQTTAQRRRSFLLYVDASGKGHYEDPEIFSMDIRGNVLSTLKVITPSFVTRNKRFDVIARFEDQFGNLTSNAPEDTLIELSYEQLRENLTWKLFVPETGFITLPNLYFNEPGIYTIQLLNTKTKEVFKSSPIKCFSESNQSLFWGLLHGESERIDSTENIENCLRHIRDEKAFNFFGTSSFENIEETSNEVWKLITQNIAEFDEADRFTTFVGFQWQGEPGEEGIRQIVYAKEGKQILRKKDVKYSSLKKIYKSFSPKELISIPCFTMAKGFEFNFKEFDPEFERVVEIYNAWGSSECTKKEGNPRPIQCQGKAGVQETAEGSIQKALQNNHRFGFVAGGLDDRGAYSDFFRGDQMQYSPGLTGIIAQEHSRNALIEALYKRSCYATTGERIIVGLYLAGMPMGSEMDTSEKHGLIVNRHISGYVAGTAPLKSVEIIRNGTVIHTLKSDTYYLNFTYDDMTTLNKVCFTPKDKKPPFVYYYLRVIQEDGNIAWSSPIWVDLVPLKPSPKKNSKALVKPSKKPIIIEDDLDEEDEDDFDDFDDETEE